MKTFTINESLIFLRISLSMFRTLHLKPDHAEHVYGQSCPRWVYKYSEIKKAEKYLKEKRKSKNV